MNCHCCVFVCVYKLDACMHAAFCLAPSSSSSSSSSCAPLCITPLANSLRTLFLMQLWQCNYLARRQRQQQKRRNYTVPSPRVLFLLSRLSLFLFFSLPRSERYCTVQYRISPLLVVLLREGCFRGWRPLCSGCFAQQSPNATLLILIMNKRLGGGTWNLVAAATVGSFEPTPRSVPSPSFPDG